LDESTTIEQIGRALSREMLRGIFPVAGTALERRGKPPRTQVVVAVRGAYQYEEQHMRILRRWLDASQARPRRAVRFSYAGRKTGKRVVWPLGIVLRDLARVYLAGVPEDADSGRDVRTYALEHVLVGSNGALPLDAVSASRPPPEGMDGARVTDAIDLPFSIFPPEVDGVMVHVRFAVDQARYIERRLWHRTQRVRRLRDGSIDIRFGPANAEEAAAWIRQWGPGVQVLGDSSLKARLLRDAAPGGDTRRDSLSRSRPSIREGTRR
jgi:predicted DNA-binding transcriptional regulator YafY